jgi:hypothetical protein
VKISEVPRKSSRRFVVKKSHSVEEVDVDTSTTLFGRLSMFVGWNKFTVAMGGLPFRFFFVQPPDLERLRRH